MKSRKGQILKGNGDPSFQIGYQVKKLTHNQKPDLEKYNSFIFTCRNPLDRLKSWFFHSHPKNDLLEKMSHPMYVSLALFECYEQLDDFLSVGLRQPVTDPDCQELARNVVRGIRCEHCQHFLHMVRNYRFYLKDILESDENKEKEIFVIRTEEFYNDLNNVNVMLGGTDGIDQYKRKPHTWRKGKESKELAVSNREISREGQRNACFFLCPEIQL